MNIYCCYTVTLLHFSKNPGFLDFLCNSSNSQKEKTIPPLAEGMVKFDFSFFFVLPAEFVDRIAEFVPECHSYEIGFQRCESVLSQLKIVPRIIVIAFINICHNLGKSNIRRSAGNMRKFFTAQLRELFAECFDFRFKLFQFFSCFHRLNLLSDFSLIITRCRKANPALFVYMHIRRRAEFVTFNIQNQ